MMSKKEPYATGKDGKYNYFAYLLADENAVSIKVAKYAGLDKVDQYIRTLYKGGISVSCVERYAYC